MHGQGSAVRRRPASRLVSGLLIAISVTFLALILIVPVASVLGYAFSRCQPRASSSFFDACVISLCFGGLLLQFRNISVFYLLPALLVWLTSLGIGAISKGRAPR